jgi:hypothetical protein
MKSLTDEQQLKMHMVRGYHMLSCDNVATMLNAKTQDIYDAQIGKSVKDEVHQAIKTWLREA